MSNNMISVPRELLRNFIEYSSSTCETDHWEKDKFALCAFLAQRCTCPSGDVSLRWPCPVCPPEPVAWANDQRLLLCSKSKLDVCHPNPAYHQLPSAIAASALATPYCNTPLYRHPAAQAPVVLPERLSTSMGNYSASQHSSGWNACLDELKRLNPDITEAAPLRKS